MSSVRGLSPFNARRQTLPDVIKALDIDSPAGIPAKVSNNIASGIKGLSNEAPSSLSSMTSKKSVLDSRKKSVFAENPVIKILLNCFDC